ncbi:thiamine phosphate synthase [Arthrobacter sp. NIO-1057]|uniref:thiamine phosphate synthase n=1 Tax=Arthrobacter sp. NIO-1057 TaxID=993071 RepID=UPI00071D92F1|nr:thiamine phosphate synthase [Arthrobacter sp. NIO-1057]KSU65141.1 thiamine-phosphate diphosphorylase [Arthrobacter sp. NIO-1057]SCC48056.1 thiamine-phosphate pyrophosphorylase [Arthrobacter sp. NIO-1057]
MDNIGAYLVANTASCTPRTTLEVIEGAVAGGIEWIQLRAKDETAREFFELTCAAAKLTEGKAKLLVNDRIDVFLAARAASAAVSGIHIGQKDIPVRLARQIIGEGIIGLSASTDEQLAQANLDAEVIDYLGVGAVRATPTKKDHPTPIGLDGFARAASLTELPCVAIGAITAQDAQAIRAGGGNGMAVVRAICNAQDPQSASEQLVAAWEAAQ